MYLKIFVVLLQFLCVNFAKDLRSKPDRYIITCHTTDFECFKRQFLGLRDHVLLGNEKLGIGTYEHFRYKYGGSGTCIKLSGIEESELVAISMDSLHKEYSIIIEMPLRIVQVNNESKPCTKPNKAFEGVGAHSGPLRRFSGNATVQITYPYTLPKKKGEVHMNLSNENIDVILDIPDLSHFNKNSKLESRLYEWSEWAYHVVQHTDVAQKVVMPFTTNLRTVMDRLPLHRFILLYPEEEYSSLQFMYTGKTVAD
ncbi:hypothetical protein O3G_MSEX005233 [Manduca sexta]|uniref:Uncharacterized protein n=1 Tax=Manduca sexta TaxID=7130 RepID=A0A921Z054_MANSE|nr:hypothetical protein O3G_MSEX005233 [Manduca sexta]